MARFGDGFGRGEDPRKNEGKNGTKPETTVDMIEVRYQGLRTIGSWMRNEKKS
jgi:hypothetical protein